MLTPRSYAAFSNGKASSAPRTQFAHWGFPIDMHPTMGTEMYRPEFPRRLYSALESSIDLATLGGRDEEVILRESGGQCWTHADDVPKTPRLEDSCNHAREKKGIQMKGSSSCG